MGTSQQSVNYARTQPQSDLETVSNEDCGSYSGSSSGSCSGRTHSIEPQQGTQSCFARLRSNTIRDAARGSSRTLVYPRSHSPFTPGSQTSGNQHQQQYSFDDWEAATEHRDALGITEKISILGYKDIKPFLTAGNVQLSQALNSTDHPVYLKTILNRTTEMMTLLKNEWNLQPLIAEIAGIQKAHSLESYDNGSGLVLVFPDCGEISSVEYFGRSIPLDMIEQRQITARSSEDTIKRVQELPIFDIDRFLEFAIEICQILGELHSAGITHHNLNPTALTIDTEGKAQIQDLAYASRLEREDPTQGIVSSSRLPFVAPESTGRINRLVDYRSDFYSLGITFYYLSTGVLPFTSCNALDLLYKHIAEAAIPSHDISHNVPKAVSLIIHKMMAKTAEDRYQTARGLLADFEELQRFEGDLMHFHDFMPGRADTASQFTIPQMLYGRDNDIESLLSAFKQVKVNGGGNVVVVKGNSGTGKSSLVNEIHRPVLEARSFYTSGKFDQYKRGLPFFSLIQAASELIRQLVSEVDVELDTWRAEIIKALDNDAAVMIDVLPELSRFLPSDFTPHSLPDLGPAEREQRFTSVFLRFLLVFAKRGYPLVMFLDDVQWSSVVEMNLVAQIAITAAQSQACSLTLIIAYRDNEVGEGHHVLFMMESIRKAHVDLRVIDVMPLSMESTREMVSATLHYPVNSENVELETFTKLILAKTGGNAFFITQLLKNFHAQSLLVFDFDARLWRFELASILCEDLPPTVVDLLVTQIQKMGSNTRRILQMAACIGTTSFTLSLLAVVCQQSRKATARDIWGALQSGLVIPTSATYKAQLGFEDQDKEDDLAAENDDEATDSSYRFLHDRVQQASYSMIPEAEHPKTHLDIGFRMRDYFEEKGTVENYIFEIVNQIDRGLDILPEGTLDDVIDLNLRAGKRALRSTAFDAALSYLDVARTVVPDSWWDDHFDLCLDIHLSYVDATYANHDYGKAVEILHQVAAKVKGSFEKAQIMYRMINCYMGQDNLANAIDVGFKALAHLGVHVPLKDEDAAAMMHDLKPKLDLAPAEIDKLAELPQCQDKHILLIQSLVATVLLPIYLSRPALLQCLCAQASLLTIKHGVSVAGAYPLIMYGVTISTAELSEKTQAQGYHYGLTAVKIVDSASAELTATTPKILKVFASHICWWNEPTRNTLVYFNSAISAGLQTFNVEYTCYGWVESCSYAMLAGEPLPSVIQRMSTYLPLVLKYKQNQSTWYLAIQLQAYINFMSEETDAFEMEGEVFSVAKEYKEMVATGSMPQIFVLHFYKMMVAVYFNMPESVAAEQHRIIEEYAFGTQGTCYIAKWSFLAASSLVGSYPTLSPGRRANFDFHFNRLRHWAKSVPSTFEHEILFIEAELLRHEGRDLDALAKFDEAYEKAIANGNVHEAGHIAERCSRWLGTKNRRLAVHHIRNAFDCFRVFGFKAKTRDLRSHYPDLFTLKNIEDRNMGHIRPFRAVNMQINRDGTLSKVGSAVIPDSSDLGALSEDDEPRDYETQATSASQSQPQRVPYTAFSLVGTNHIATNSEAQDLSICGSGPSSFAKINNESCSNSNSRGLMPPSGGTMSSRLSYDEQNGTPVAEKSSEVRSRSNPEPTIDYDLDIALKTSVLISEVLSVSDVLRRLIDIVLKNAGADYGVLLLMDKENLYVEGTGRNHDVQIVQHQLLSMQSDVVPSSLVNYVARLKEAIVLGVGNDFKSFQAKFGRDSYFKNRKLRSVMCMPIQNSVKLIGVLYLENSVTAYAFGPRRVELLNFLCTQAAIAIEKARLYSDLEVAKDEAQASNRMKSEFLSTMSHEIRTPFNAVLGMTGFLLDTKLTPIQVDYVETIRNSSKELLRVIDDILDFSKMEHGKLELHKADFSLRDCIEGAMQITAERAASKELELAYFNKHDDFPDVLINDITRFRQIVINLLGNAIKFTESGSVTVTSNAVLLRPASGTDLAVYRVQVSVRDTGIGIKEEDHDKLFRLFSQIDSSLTRNFSGTGLGLAISEKLVRLMGGQIWCDSKADQGSTFHFTIVTEVKDVVAAAPHPMVARLRGKGVIILDDSIVASCALTGQLEKMAMRAVTVTNITDLTNTICQNPPGSFSIAFIDLHYGLSEAILPEIARIDPNCKIIRLSRFGVRQQFDDKYPFLIKPVKKERLTKVILELFFPDTNTTPRLSVSHDQGKVNSIGMATRHPLRILLAEDNPINSRVALQHLKKMGYTAIHAKDGQVAVEEEAKRIFDVILMDVQMPRLDGHGATRLIRARYADNLASCPTIIAMTANAMSGDKERCLEAGMHDYCAKPIIVEKLAEVLLNCHRRLKD